MELDFKSSDGSPEIVNSKYYKVIFGGFLLLLINAGYLAGASSSSFFYYANILLHIVLGLALIVPLYTKVRYYIKTDMLHGKTFGETVGRLGYLTMQISFLTGVYLLIAGNVKGESYAFYIHGFTGFFASMCLISSIRRAAYNVSVENTYWRAGRWGLTIFLVALIIPLFSFMIKSAFLDESEAIMNQGIIPSSLEEANEEGDQSLFYPSPAETRSKGLLATEFLQESQSCGRSGCHIDIVEQFTDSPHNQSALDDEHYIATFRYVQNRFGADAGKFCAACHTPAQLFDGSAVDVTLAKSSEVQAKFSCASCHAIQSVKNTLGNGAYIMDRPAIAGLSVSDNSNLNKLHDFLVFADPDPHRDFMFRPFMSKQSGEFCSACHKLTLEKPFVDEKPVPGLLNYDYWAGGRFARQDIKAFGPIEDKLDCMDCHMPRTDGSGPGSSEGRVKSHAFASPQKNVLAFNSAADDSQQTQLFELEIFSVRPSKAYDKAGRFDGPLPQYARAAQTTAETAFSGEQFHRGADRTFSARFFDRSTFEEGAKVEINVLIKTRNIGHAFPGGNPGGAEAWLEIFATDNHGQTLYHNGKVNEQNEIDPSAKYFGMQFSDKDGQPVYWAHGIGAETTSRFNLLLPNTIQLSRHTFLLPENAGERFEISARLHYRERKIIEKRDDDSHGETNGKARGVADSALPDNLSITYTDATTLAADVITIAETAGKKPEQHPASAQGWNDYGIGLLMQNKLAEARNAFEHASQLQPEWSEALLNIARSDLLAGDPKAAQQAIERIAEKERDSPKVQFFWALALKAQGEFQQAKSILNKLRKVITEDRAILNELGHTYFLLESYTAAHRIFRSVTNFAPDDPVAHYFLSHTYRKLKKPEKAAYEEKLYAKYSTRINQYVIEPTIRLEAAYQHWQILPWMNYDNYAYRQGK